MLVCLQESAPCDNTHYCYSNDVELCAEDLIRWCGSVVGCLVQSTPSFQAIDRTTPITVAV